MTIQWKIYHDTGFRFGNGDNDDNENNEDNNDNQDNEDNDDVVGLMSCNLDHSPSSSFNLVAIYLFRVNEDNEDNNDKQEITRIMMMLSDWCLAI